MAAISQYVAKGTHAGQKVIVKAKKFVWIPVGKGVVQSYSDFDVDIAGAMSFLGYNGDLNIQLELLDKNPTATSGPCVLQLNSHRDPAANYVAKNGALKVTAVLGGKNQSIRILPSDNGTQTECKLEGYVNQTVHLEPTA
jgi:hypothetical protein